VIHLRSIAQTIIDQIYAQNPWALASWGARKYLIEKVDGNVGVSFSVNGTKTKHGSRILILYDEQRDLYNVYLYRFYKRQHMYDNQVEGVFFDQLVEIIDDMVG